MSASPESQLQKCKDAVSTAVHCVFTCARLSRTVSHAGAWETDGSGGGASERGPPPKRKSYTSCVIRRRQPETAQLD